MYSLSFSRLRGIVNTLTLSLTALCAAAPAVVAAQGTPVRGGTLIAVVQPEPQVLTSAINTGNPTGVVSVNIFDGLLSYDEKLAPQPALAQSWQISQDGKSITFHLRHGVKWHDGAPFTSADVRFSALEIWKKVHPRGRVTFAELRDVETPDAYTAVFRLDHPSPAIMSALNAMEGQILPEHIYGGTDIAKTALSKPPIGTGPFRFKEWKKGQYIELERNPDYWDSGKPYIDKLIFRIIPDAATRSAAFETGDVQYGAYSIVPLSDVARLTKLPTIGIQTHGYEWGAPFLTLEFNLRHAPLNQLKVRQAIAQAVDKRGLIDTVWYGFGKPATGPVPSPLKNFYTADVQHYDYNVAQAEKLLDAAGYPRKADGVRFNLSIDYMAYGDVYRDSAEYLRQNLKRVGINVTVHNQDLSTYVRRVYSNYDFDLNLVQMSAFMDPQMGIHRLLSTRGISQGIPWTNASGFSNAEMDRVIEASQTDNDPARRTEEFHQLQRISQQNLPLLPLIELQHFTLYNRRLHGLSSAPDASEASLKDVWLSR